MILVIDNYDSFTYNLVQYLGELGAELKVVRNDALTVTEAFALNPSHIVVSPGPCTPTEAGISVELIKNIPSHIPLLGVCLGHQAIGQAFGGNVIRAPFVVHGKTDHIHIDKPDSKLMKDVETPFIATRYHSLIVEKKSLPSCLVATASTKDDLIMALEHKERPIYGLQFHPESILTGPGKVLLGNFIRIGAK